MLPYLLKCLHYEHDRSYFEHVFMKIIANIKDSTDKKNILRILSDINNGIFVVFNRLKDLSKRYSSETPQTVENTSSLKSFLPITGIFEY